MHLTVWTNLLVKLTPLLEENRERRLAREKEENRIMRRRRLHDLLVNVKFTAHPFSAAMEVLVPGLAKDLLSTSQPSEFNFVPKTRPLPAVLNPFPPIAVILEWECLKDLSETELSVERVEELFHERREQLDKCLTDWRENLEKRLVEILNTKVKTTSGAAVEIVEAIEMADGEEIEAEPNVKVSLIYHIIRYWLTRYTGERQYGLN